MKIYRVAYVENEVLPEQPVRLMREWRTYKCDVCGFYKPNRPTIMAKFLQYAIDALGLPLMEQVIVFHN